MTVSRRNFVRGLIGVTASGGILAFAEKSEAATGAAAFWYQTIVNERFGDDWYIYYLIPVGKSYSVTSSNAGARRTLSWSNITRKSRVRVNGQTYDAVQILIGLRARLNGGFGDGSWKGLTFFRALLTVTYTR
jgi:hypothetical protein